MTPSKKLVGSLRMLDFNQNVIGPMIEQGKNDGANAINLGEGTMFNLLKEYVELPQHLKKELDFQTFASIQLNQVGKL